MIIPRPLPIPDPVPPTPRVGPPRERDVDADQGDLIEHIDAHPVPSDIGDEVDDGLSYADHAVPRWLPLNEIVSLAKLVFGQTWIGPAATVMGVTERQVRRWRAGESRPSAAHLDRMRDEAEVHFAHMSSALRLGRGVPEAERKAPVSKPTNPPHVGDRKAIAEALAIHVELRKAARVKRPKAPRKGTPVDDT